MKKILKNRYFQFFLISVMYALWVLWIKNPWFFIGHIIIIEIFFIRKINWRFWQKKGTSKKLKYELIDALIIALALAFFVRTFFLEVFVIPTPSMEKTLETGDFIFVSKLHYGPRMPVTPIGIPFTHNYIPGTHLRSYIAGIQLPFKRLNGFGDIKSGDIIVFNLPIGDTVFKLKVDEDYYSVKRQNEDESSIPSQNKIYHPIDKRQYYVKRCVGMPGDTIIIKPGKVLINNIEMPSPDKIQYNYLIKTDGNEIPFQVFKNMGISFNDIKLNKSTWLYEIPLTQENKNKIDNLKSIQGVRKIEKTEGSVFNYTIFPYSIHYLWAEDNFGPLLIPSKGSTIELNMQTLPLYRRVIETYEGNKLTVKNTKILINDKKADNYTFKKDYYFVLGDNRHNSFDSRFLGFLPKDHIVGKAIFVWFSYNKNGKGLKKIRWKQIFKIIR